MALTATDRGFVSQGSASNYTFGTITPTASTWLICDVIQSAGTPSSNVPTLSGAGLTYTQEATVTGVGGSALNDRITRFSAWTGSSPGTFSITVDFAGQTQNSCGLHVTEIGGGDSNDIILQNVTNAASTGSPATCTLAAFGSSNNRPIALILTGNGGGDITPEGSWTELRESNVQTSECEGETEWLSSATDTTPTATFTAGNWAIIGSELQAEAVGGTTVLDPFGMSGFFGS